METQNNKETYYAPYTPQYPPYVKKVYSPLEKKDGRFFLIFFLCSAVFTDFALFRGFHLGFTVSYALIFASATAYIWDKSKKPSPFSVICGAISLAGAVTLSLFSDKLINAFMLIMIAGLFTIYCTGISNTFNNSQGNYKLLFDLAFSAFINPLENLSEVIGSVKTSVKKKSKSLPALIGILLSVPVLFIIVPLLVSSDAAFEGLVTTVIKKIGVYLLELAVAVIVFPFAYSFMFGKRKRLNVKQGGEKKDTERKFPVSGSVSFLCAISLVYVAYLFSQLAYFFSAFKGILPEGYKHSASVYARRGFFEMFAVVAINIALVSVISAFTKRNNGRVSAAIKGVSLFISLFSTLMLAIAMQKMRLNIATYGYSRNRLLVCAFMLMMLIVIAFFIIHIFAPKIQYMQIIIIACVVIFTVLSFADINAMTARYNTAVYSEGKLKSVNVEYIAELGDSTVPSLVKLTKSDDKKTAARAKIALAKYAADSKDFKVGKDNMLIKKQTDFRAYSAVKARAAAEINDYIKTLNPAQRAVFIKQYKYFTNHAEESFEYDSENDAYENWGGGGRYKYNPKSGEFQYRRD